MKQLWISRTPNLQQFHICGGTRNPWALQPGTVDPDMINPRTCRNHMESSFKKGSGICFCVTRFPCGDTDLTKAIPYFEHPKVEEVVKLAVPSWVMMWFCGFFLRFFQGIFGWLRVCRLHVSTQQVQWIIHSFASVYQSIDSMIYCTFSVFLKFKEQSSFKKMPVTRLFV